MKIKFKAEELAAHLGLIRNSLSTSKGVVGEDTIGLGARAGQLIAYAYAKGCWVRVVLSCEVEEPGVVIVGRARFFKLLDALKQGVELKTLPSGRIQIELQEAVGKFTLATSQAEMPRPRIDASVQPTLAKSSSLRDQLQLSILDGGELMGGGYRVTGQTNLLTVMASDRQRLVVTKQFVPPESVLDLSINHAAVKGVFEILKAADQVEVRASHNLTSFTALLENDQSVEFGYTNLSETFPDVIKLLVGPNYQNSAQFDAGDLVEAISRADALADDELPSADFNFSTSDVCALQAANVDGSAEMLVDCDHTIQDETTNILRLQLPHLKSLLNKARACGAVWVTCQWGAGNPVKWSFDFEEAKDHKYSNIDLIFITAALNRNAGTTA